MEEDRTQDRHRNWAELPGRAAPLDHYSANSVLAENLPTAAHQEKLETTR